MTFTEGVSSVRMFSTTGKSLKQRMFDFLGSMMSCVFSFVMVFFFLVLSTADTNLILYINFK